MKRGFGSGVCPRCGKGFKKKGGNHTYCSLECSSPAHRTRFTIFNRDGFQCIYCGKTSFGNGARLTVDHIRPTAKGGESIACNLATACPKCNGEKNRSIILNEDAILSEVSRRNRAAGIEPGRQFSLDQSNSKEE